MPVKSKAEIAAVFTGTVDRLAETAGKSGRMPLGEGTRVWQTPPLGAWDGDHAKIEEIGEAFNRDDLNDKYASAVSDANAPGTVGDLVGLITQISYLGAMERGYRARHASPLRCLIHSAARRKGHGHDAGVLKGGVVGYVTDSIAAGQAEQA